MKNLTVSLLLGLLCASNALAQSDDEELKIAAMEALISAPPSRALPLARKALKGDHSDEVKERALYAAGDEDVRDAVLDAYLIADDKEAVFQLAANATTEDEFEAAVDRLGAMNAREQLRRLRDKVGMSESLIDAYAISGDKETLRELARDNSDPERQMQAVEALGIIGGDDLNAVLVDIYRSATSDDIREAALDGMLISGHDEGVLELYRSSQDSAEKRELLEYLVMMGSDDVWNLIESALDDTQ